MSDDQGSWAPFGRYGDDPPPAEAEDPAPVEEPAPVVFEPPAAPPTLVGSPQLTWPAPDPKPPGAWPPPAPTAAGPVSQPWAKPGKKTADNAVASLVLGIVGLTMCPVLGSVGAIALGLAARRQIDANPALGGETIAAWGIGLGAIGVAFAAIVLIAIVGVM